MPTSFVRGYYSYFSKSDPISTNDSIFYNYDVKGNSMEGKDDNG